MGWSCYNFTAPGSDSPLMAGSGGGKPARIERAAVPRLGDAMLKAQVQQHAFSVVQGLSEDLIATVMTLAAIPAPSGAEAERAVYLIRRFAELGLTDVHQDSTGNVVGIKSGAGGGPRLLISSNMDTPYPPGTDCTPRRLEDHLYGPGVRDNAAGLAVIIGTLTALSQAQLALPGDLVIGATVAEEGGNLDGMRGLMRNWADKVDAVLYLGGDLANVHHDSLGIRRLAVEITGPGGHSWTDQGRPSANHLLARIITAFTALPLPQKPRTTVNVGLMHGGMSANSIAAAASATFEIRSEGAEPLDRLERSLREIITREAKAPGIRATCTVTGDIPFGGIAADHPLVLLVAEAHRAIGLPVRSAQVSTDANIPLALGVPAVVQGASTGGGSKSPTAEHLDGASLVTGVKSLLMALALIMDHYPLRRAKY